MSEAIGTPVVAKGMLRFVASDLTALDYHGGEVERSREQTRCLRLCGLEVWRVQENAGEASGPDCPPSVRRSRGLIVTVCYSMAETGTVNAEGNYTEYAD
jgi:hypothetical protein